MMENDNCVTLYVIFLLTDIINNVVSYADMQFLVRILG